MPDKPRSKKTPARSGERSAFSVMLDQSIPVQSGRKQLTVGPAEALRFKIYDEAMQGKIGAARTVIAWIKEREVSIGVQTGPPIGAQKGPPFTMAQG